MKRFVHSFRILNRHVLIESDSPDFIRMFDMDYSRFRSTAARRRPSTSGRDPSSSIGKGETQQPQSQPAQLDFAVLLHEKGREPVIRWAGRNFSLAGYPHEERYAYRFVIERIIREMDGFFMLHAGVVARGGKALILAGPPGIGKTTMVLELLKWGFSFCSDDYGPVHKTTGLVFPFPRSPWSADCQQSEAEGGAPPLRKEKQPLDLDALGYPIAKDPQEIAAVLCLTGDEASNNDREFRIELTGDYEEVIPAFLSLKNTHAERIDALYPAWRIRYPSGDGLSEQMKRIIEGYKDVIRNVYRIYPGQDFSKKAELTPISSHEAAFRLVCDQKRDMSISGNNENRSFGPLGEVMALSVLLDGVPCYRLSVGERASMMMKIDEVIASCMD